MLMEWMSARQVHPPGSVMADRRYIERLAHVDLCILRADACARRIGGVPGEGRAEFVARTSR
jgi:hypothetical protein